MSQAYATEEQVAVAAVRRACHLTSSVFNKLVKNEMLTKDDKSPVTGAFYRYSLLFMQMVDWTLIPVFLLFFGLFW